MPVLSLLGSCAHLCGLATRTVRFRVITLYDAHLSCDELTCPVWFWIQTESEDYEVSLNRDDSGLDLADVKEEMAWMCFRCYFAMNP